MEQGNERTVYVVQVDNNKDLSDAKKYGKLRAIFANPRKPYDTNQLLNKARRELKDWQQGDYLLIIGDPTLCAVVMSVITEYHSIINVLSWDRNQFQYTAQRWDFGILNNDEFAGFISADD
jgi:hypothetical protein